MIDFSVSEVRSTNATDRLYLSDYLPAWHLDAECRGSDPNLFFPEQGSSTRKAKEMCARCPVRQECLDAALAMPEAEALGIWGGTSTRVRRELRKDVA